jgi:hypothetical protein
LQHDIATVLQQQLKILWQTYSALALRALLLCQTLCGASVVLRAAVLQVAAELQVEAGVGRVEAALRCKLVQTQALAQGLEAALAAVNSEMAGLSRAQQRLMCMKEHLQAKVAVNKSRQQVRMFYAWRETGMLASTCTTCTEYQSQLGPPRKEPYSGAWGPTTPQRSCAAASGCMRNVGVYASRQTHVCKQYACCEPTLALLPCSTLPHLSQISLQSLYHTKAIVQQPFDCVAVSMCLACRLLHPAATAPIQTSKLCICMFVHAAAHAGAQRQARARAGV